jgi:hypothetical protein
VILERVWPSGCSVASFDGALERLTAAGLAYDRDERSGVVFANAYDEQFRGIMYCVVAETIERGWQIDAQLRALFKSDVVAAT